MVLIKLPHKRLGVGFALHPFYGIYFGVIFLGVPDGGRLAHLEVGVPPGTYEILHDVTIDRSVMATQLPLPVHSSSFSASFTSSPALSRASAAMAGSRVISWLLLVLLEPDVNAPAGHRPRKAARDSSSHVESRQLATQPSDPRANCFLIATVVWLRFFTLGRAK